MTITISGNVTKDALAVAPIKAAYLKLQINELILAKEANTMPWGVQSFEPDELLDERIVWTEVANDEGLTITGTLEAAK